MFKELGSIIFFKKKNIDKYTLWQQTCAFHPENLRIKAIDKGTSHINYFMHKHGVDKFNTTTGVAE